MTKQERDRLRAETAMRVLSAMFDSQTMSKDAVLNDQSRSNARRAKRAAWAVTEANALIAELAMHEEAEAVLFPNGEEPENLLGMSDAELLAKYPLDNSHTKCAHNIPITELCAMCELSQLEEQLKKS